MVNDVKEENNSPRPPARDGAGNDTNNNNNNRRGGRRGARNRWNNATAGGTPTQNNAAKYKSRNKDIPDDVVFDNAGHVFISHTHWDHIQGFPFFAPLFIQGGNEKVGSFQMH